MSARTASTMEDTSVETHSLQPLPAPSMEYFRPSQKGSGRPTQADAAIGFICAAACNSLGGAQAVLQGREALTGPHMVQEAERTGECPPVFLMMVPRSRISLHACSRSLVIAGAEDLPVSHMLVQALSMCHIPVIFRKTRSQTHFMSSQQAAL